MANPYILILGFDHHLFRVPLLASSGAVALGGQLIHVIILTGIKVDIVGHRLLGVRFLLH